MGFLLCLQTKYTRMSIAIAITRTTMEIAIAALFDLFLDGDGLIVLLHTSPSESKLKKTSLDRSVQCLVTCNKTVFRYDESPAQISQAKNILKFG